MSQLNLVQNVSSVATPAAGKVSIYAKTDQYLYIKDDSGVETNLTAASSNDSRANIAMHATTMDLWGTANILDGTSSAVTITAIADAPQAGARRVLYPVAASVITNGATFAVDGAANATAAAGDAWEFEAVTTSTYKVHVTKKDGTAVVGGTQTSKIQSVDYALAANALTLKLNPTSLDFRSATLTDGVPVTVSNSAQITTTISSGSTGGTVSAVQSNIYILAINNAGTMELAWCNAGGGINLDETTLISTTAEGGAGAADSATVIYSTTARSNVAFRVVGLFRSTQTTAGTWAQTPSLVQGYGGQALAAMSSLGYGQTWQVVTGSRSSGVTYYNTTGKPIFVQAALNALGNITPTVGGVSLGGQYVNCHFIVPPSTSYSITAASLAFWNELR